MNFLYPKPGSALKLTVSSRLSRHIHVSMAFYTTDASKMQLPPRPPRTQSLAGTVVDHTSYLFLHTRVPPESWPKTFSSPLFLQLKERLGKYGGLVNVSWSEPGPSVSSLIGLSESIEAYTGTFWTRTEGRDVCRGVHLPMVTTNNMSIFDENLGQLADGNSVLCSVDSRTTDIMPMGPYFYICCHGHRDCRCGFRGGDLADALTDELAKRNMLLDEHGRPRLSRVGHVGGHKYVPTFLYTEKLTVFLGMHLT